MNVYFCPCRRRESRAWSGVDCCSSSLLIRRADEWCDVTLTVFGMELLVRSIAEPAVVRYALAPARVLAACVGSCPHRHPTPAAEPCGGELCLGLRPGTVSGAVLGALCLGGAVPCLTTPLWLITVPRTLILRCATMRQPSGSTVCERLWRLRMRRLGWQRVHWQGRGQGLAMSWAIQWCVCAGRAVGAAACATAVCVWGRRLWPSRHVVEPTSAAGMLWPRASR